LKRFAQNQIFISLSNELYETNLLSQEDELKLRLKLREHQFLWANVSQRNRNSWSMGAFFVPISFLIFGYAATTQNLSWSNLCILSVASVSTYAAWLILYWRNNKANEIYTKRMTDIENKLENEMKIRYKPLSETDDQRKAFVVKWGMLKIRPLTYKFPERVWKMMLVVLIVLWIVLVAVNGIN